MATELAEAADCLLSMSDEWQALAAEQTVSTLQVTRWQGAQATVQPDALAQEIPIALIYNGVSHVVMLGTPADLEDFAYGFSFTEGIISARNQIYGVEVKALYHPHGLLQGLEVHVSLATEQFTALKAQRRNLTGRTGCGLCGAESLQQVFKQPGMRAGEYADVTVHSIETAMAQLKSQQPLQQLSGATHASALADADGHIVAVREDVGRHNALDKLIGYLLRQESDLSAIWKTHWVLTTSRASYEMVQKVAMTGGRVLVAMSAPTALAVSLAEEYDFLLVGFARASQCVVYHGQLSDRA